MNVDSSIASAWVDFDKLAVPITNLLEVCIVVFMYICILHVGNQ